MSSVLGGSSGYLIGSVHGEGKDKGFMKHVMRRTKGIRWDLWHRTTVTRSLELLVMNRVVRRAEVDPPRQRIDSASMKPDRKSSTRSTLPANFDAGGWFTSFVRRRVGSPFTDVRHST
jgi:hypothetical protein